MPDIVKRLAPSHGFMLEADQMGGGKFQIGLRLCFDFAAFARIKERTGIELWNDLPKWGELESSSVLPLVFWAAILRHQPQYDSEDGLDAVGSWIDAGNAGKIVDALFEAYLVTLPLSVSKPIREAVEKHKKGIEGPTNQAPEETPATSA